MARVFSPLDEELALAPGSLAPGLHAAVVRLATWIPSFAHAARELAALTGSHLSEATVRRLTEAAGAAYVALQTAEGERLADAAPPPPAGPSVQQLSVDGALVPLVGGEWAAVTTLVVGTLTGQASAEAVRATDLSYFSRLADAEAFTATALVETHRRGTLTAGLVTALLDGAVWQQGFMDVHRVDAVRILDFPHAAEYLTRAAQAVYGPGTAAGTAWMERQRHELRHGDPDAVLAALRALQEEAQGAAVGVVSASLADLEQRREQTRYAEYELWGLPLGSGIVESANKLVVEERLKGRGMHWARGHVNPLLALRTVGFNDRWAEVWPQIVRQLRQERATGAAGRRAARRGRGVGEGEREQPAEPGAPTAPVGALTAPAPRARAADAAPPRPTGRSRPAPDHPWRHARIGRGSPRQPATTAA